MKKTLLVLLVTAFSFPAFSSITLTLTMSFEDTTRSFLVHFPTGFNNSQHVPVVINMHGSGSDGPQEEFYSRMSETADSNHFMAVYPNGLGNVWNSGFTPPYNSFPDDVGFVSKIIDTLYTLYSIDLSRVYATGMSNGGFQSYRLACDLENRIAAIASVTGAMTDLTVSNCQWSRRMPVMEIHGTADPLVPYGGQTGITSVEETMGIFRARNLCATTTDTIDLPDLDPNDSSTVQRIQWTNCVDGMEVVLYKITGGGHTWPNAYYPFIYGPTNHDLDASQEIWNFFKRFTINGPTAVEEVKSDIDVNVYPNPGNGVYQLSITNYHSLMRATVLDVTGKKILEQKISSPVTEFHLENVSTGIYLLKIEGKGALLTRKIVKQ
jgi:polyhydroxybutyrate depolymerase